MNLLKSFVVAALLFATSPALSANPWYVGATQGLFAVGESDKWIGKIDIGQAGLQVGKFLRDDMSIEGGYAFNSDRSDFFIGSVSAVFWMGENTDKYQPYVLMGANVYHFDDDEDESLKRRSAQIAFGAGFATKISQSFQFRADLRLMARDDENEDDVALQLSINKFFE
ncbi:MAG: outer membrane beta-barrel protein [Porticoccaceae bacterium]